MFTVIIVSLDKHSPGQTYFIFIFQNEKASRHKKWFRIREASSGSLCRCLAISKCPLRLYPRSIEMM